MIPKIIHYIWIGGKPLPKLAEKCIKSWKVYCPDYEIKKWDESNLNLTKYEFVQEAYKANKYAFASDVLRADILYNHGGIYLDVDVELIKPIDEFLNLSSFAGIETSSLIGPGLIWGAKAGDAHMKAIIEIYKNTKFDIDNMMQLTSPKIFTSYFEKLGFEKTNKTQNVSGVTFFSSQYFSPIDTITNKKTITKNTVSIHWYEASWYTKKKKVIYKTKKYLNRIFFGLPGKAWEKLAK